MLLGRDLSRSIFTTFFFFKIFFVSSQCDQQVTMEVEATVYNALPGQCNEDYLTTASGLKINKDNLPRIIAVSRDLEKHFPLGTKVRICNTGKFDGIYWVEDRMNRRWRRKIDILVNDNIKLGKWKKVLITKM